MGARSAVRNALAICTRGPEIETLAAQAVRRRKLKVYIANFGRENYEWPRCLERSTVATMNAEPVHGFWLARDRESYIRYCIEHVKTASGITPTRPVASRWFNLRCGFHAMNWKNTFWT